MRSRLATWTLPELHVFERLGRPSLFEVESILLAEVSPLVHELVDALAAGSGPTDCARRIHTPGEDGKLPPAGTTVDAKGTTWTNTIGAPERIAAWRDRDSNPEQPAFHHGRVIEIPTPR